MKNSQIKVSICDAQNFTSIKNIYSSLLSLTEDYPNFENWFFEKVVPDTISGKRMIYCISINEDIAGILILKLYSESKICTLRVSPEYRHMGLGSYLMELAINKLNNNYPLITVSDSHISDFKPLFDKFGFKLNQLCLNYYRENHIELVYNGKL